MSIFLKSCEFVTGAATLEALPPAALPEIAFAGRSNVGKSSLINGLTRRTGLAKASNTPGRTQQINFFLLAGQALLVDLPGYGYAKAARKEAAQWMRLVRAYLASRPNLRRVCILVDSRHGLKDTDSGIMDMLDTAAVGYQIILTKTDKVKPAELGKLREETLHTIRLRPAAHPEILDVSSRSGDGIEILRAALEHTIPGR